MSSTFGTAFAAAANPLLVSEFGISVTYTAAGGADDTVTAIWHGEDRSVIADEDGETLHREAIISLPLSEIAAPQVNDTVTAGGETWHVAGLVSGSRGGAAKGLDTDAGWASLRITRTERITLSDRKYRAV